MIGWKRIVVTVGEKIGKSHLTYAQGASAELMAAATIGVADFMGLPVSTTHVLSSGIAGSMAANKSGLQKDTLISILMAWVLTLPVCIFLGATLFSVGLYHDASPLRRPVTERMLRGHESEMATMLCRCGTPLAILPEPRGTRGPASSGLHP